MYVCEYTYFFQMNILSACSVSDSVFRFLLNRRPILYKLHCFMLKENRLSHPAAAAAKSLQSCPTDSVQPHRLQPTRLCSPWDSPGKYTGGGCHFLFHCMRVKSESEATQSCPTHSDPMDCGLPGSSIHGIF